MDDKFGNAMQGLDPEAAAIMQARQGGGAEQVPPGMDPREFQLRKQAAAMGIPGAMEMPLPELQQAFFQAQSMQMGGGAAAGQQPPPYQPPTMTPADPNAELMKMMGAGGGG